MRGIQAELSHLQQGPPPPPNLEEAQQAPALWVGGGVGGGGGGSVLKPVDWSLTGHKRKNNIKVILWMFEYAIVGRYICAKFGLARGTNSNQTLVTYVINVSMKWPGDSVQSDLQRVA